jgi:hypothetical protein
MRSVVERVELRDERVPRRVLEVVRALAVEARREVMVMSRAVSCSGLMPSSGFWGGSVCGKVGWRRAKDEGGLPEAHGRQSACLFYVSVCG